MGSRETIKIRIHYTAVGEMPRSADFAVLLRPGDSGAERMVSPAKADDLALGEYHAEIGDVASTLAGLSGVVSAEAAAAVAAAVRWQL